MSCVRARSTIIETPLVRTNGILMVAYIAFRINKKRLMRQRMGLIGMQCNNQTELGRGSRKDAADTKVSINLSILSACVSSLYSRYTPFLCSIKTVAICIGEIFLQIFQFIAGKTNCNNSYIYHFL